MENTYLSWDFHNKIQRTHLFSYIIEAESLRLEFCSKVGFWGASLLPADGHLAVWSHGPFSIHMCSLTLMTFIQFSSVSQSCLTLCDPMNRSMPGLPVHHQLPEFTQTHLHRVGDAIQPSHPLLSPSPTAPNPSQHQGLFQLVNSSGSFTMSQLFAQGGQSIGVSALVSVLPKNSQDWSPLEWTGWISLQSKWLSTAFSKTTVQKHQFFGAQLSSQSNSHIHTWPLEKA